MEISIKDLIRSRKSVRTFDGRSLTDEDKSFIIDAYSSLVNPWGVPVVFCLLDAEEYGLSSPVIVGEKEYLAAKIERVRNYEIAFGYSFEKMCLIAASRGIGTVMLAASLNRSAFEGAMKVGEHEVLPVASPVGYPAGKMSIRETIMRKGIKADTRMPFNKMSFDRSFDKGIGKEESGVFAETLEAVRLAPSAANGQPWRAVVDGDSVHFYEAKTMKDSRLGDIQKVDVGIALAHFDMVREEDGIPGIFEFSDPGIDVPENTKYIVTFRRQA